MIFNEDKRYIELLKGYKTTDEYSDLTSAVLYYLTANKSHTTFLKKREFIFKVFLRYAPIKKDIDGVSIIDFRYFPQELADKIIAKHREDSLADSKSQIQDLVTEMDEIWKL